MSINTGMPAKPEDENKGDPSSNAVDVADMGLQGASALLGPRGSSVPSVSGAPDAAAAAVETEAAAQAKTAAASSDSGLSVVGDIAEGVVDVITGIFDAT
jgi:hypothetical protein